MMRISEFFILCFVGLDFVEALFEHFGLDGLSNFDELVMEALVFLL